MTGEMLTPGDRAPDFALPDAAGETVRLADLLAGHDGAVLFFYPKAFTPGCTTEACDFAAWRPSLEAAGVAVVGIARDEPARLADFAAENGLTYPLLSDAGREVHAAYGVLKEVGGAEKVRRSTFLIGSEGLVREAWHDVTVDGHAETVAEAAAAALG